MTISNVDSAFVWLWLPDIFHPVVVGKLEKNGLFHDFFYGQSYLENPNAIALSIDELPLIPKKRFTSQHEIHDVIRDSMPDAWGQRILQQRYPKQLLSPLNLLLLSRACRQLKSIKFNRYAINWIFLPQIDR